MGVGLKDCHVNAHLHGAIQLGSSVWMVSVGQIIPFMPSVVANMSFSHGWIALISVFSLMVHCPLR